MTTSYRNIRKEGKAHWVYECTTCGILHRAPDLFRAVEARQAHLLTSAHVFAGMRAATQALVDAFIEAGNAAKSALEPLMALAATPPVNTWKPKDPTVWADKRKWGDK